MKANFKSLVNTKAFLVFAQLSGIVAFIFSILFCMVSNLLFADAAMTTGELGTLFLNTLVVSWLFIVTVKLSFTIALSVIRLFERAGELLQSKSFSAFKLFIPAFILACWLLSSCNGVPLAGINKDLNTGMVTSYSKIKPENTVLLMNEEKLGHTQIPLGEKFVVVNEKVQGLVVKDNKVSIGCSLVISDNQGKELLNEADLFKNGSGIYDPKDAEYLKCTVSTGKPMDFDKEYKVAVKFWDKYGSGSIENKLTISIIDTP